MYLLYTSNHITHKRRPIKIDRYSKSAHVQKQHVVVCSSGSGVLEVRYGVRYLQAAAAS